MSGKITDGSSVAEFTETPGHIVVGGVSKTVPFSASLRLPPVELIKLYQTIRHAIPDQQSHIVQFSSAYHGEGTNLIGFEWAVVAATQFGQRVLFVDTSMVSKRAKEQRSKLAAAVTTPLGDLLRKGGNLSDALIGLSGTSVVYTTLRRQNDQSSILVELETLGELLHSLRESYDLIVIPSPAVGADVLSLSLAKLVDGTVLVIQAERTRLPVAQQTLQTIEASGGRVIGAVLNRRRFYIPRWIYRWF